MEAAWGKVPQDIGEDPGYVAATHGKRTVDNLSHLIPDDNSWDGVEQAKWIWSFWLEDSDFISWVVTDFFNIDFW